MQGPAGPVAKRWNATGIRKELKEIIMRDICLRVYHRLPPLGLDAVLLLFLTTLVCF
jgi:hypothetical protein